MTETRAVIEYTGYGGRTREAAERHAASLRRLDDRSDVRYIVRQHPKRADGFGVYRVARA